MNIAFAVNRLALTGLGPTVTSLVRNCSDSAQLTLWFLCADLHAKDKQNLQVLLDEEGFRGEARYVDFDAKAVFGHLPALHGDWTPYGRLLIPRHVPAASCVYLDADLIVALDILTIGREPLHHQLLAATYGCTVADSLDGRFFTQNLGWSTTRPYFNSGVLVLNCAKWREQDFDSAWHRLASQHRDALISHDQTILNALCGGDFARLPAHFNNEWYAANPRPPRAEQSILHFVGSPKPWDLLGRVLHNGFHTWASYRNARWDRQYNGLDMGKVARYWNIRRSIIRSLLKKTKRTLS